MLQRKEVYKSLFNALCNIEVAKQHLKLSGIGQDDVKKMEEIGSKLISIINKYKK